MTQSLKCRRANNSLLDGTAVLLTAGARGILTRLGNVGAGDDAGKDVETGGRGVAKGSEKNERSAEQSPKAAGEIVASEPEADAKSCHQTFAALSMDFVRV